LLFNRFTTKTALSLFKHFDKCQSSKNRLTTKKLALSLFKRFEKCQSSKNRQDTKYVPSEVVEAGLFSAERGLSHTSGLL
jgi:hypothetical protein